MIVVKCDRCPYTKECDVGEANPPGFRIISIEAAFGEPHKQYQLCGDCVKLIKEALRPTIAKTL